jgi:16S rRNA (guanine1516-N2)-methyltransferase
VVRGAHLIGPHCEMKILADEPADAMRAELLRTRLGGIDAGPFHLTITHGRVLLGKTGERGSAHVTLGDVERRARGARGGLARACGVRTGLTVLDAMAGYGLDGLVLASLGCDVVLVERSPIVFTLLEDLVVRWRSLHPAACIAIECGDGTSRFADGVFDVIYLDPMFPARSKAALPGKRLQYLHELVGDAVHDVEETLLERARRAAKERVVLKRRRTDPMVGTPDWRIVTKTVRFDVYRALTG